MDVLFTHLDLCVPLGLIGIVIYFMYVTFIELNYDNLPPGPRGLDIVKLHYHLLIRRTPLHLLLSKEAEKYGDLMLTKIGGKPMLFLNEQTVARELMNGDKFRTLTAHRYSSTLTDNIFWGDRSIQFGSYSSKKRNQRTLFAKCVTESGYKNYDDLMVDEMDRLLRQLSQKEGEDMNVMKYVIHSLQRGIFLLLVGSQPPNDALVEDLTDMGITMAGQGTPFLTALSLKWPFIYHVPLIKRVITKVKQARDAMMSILLENAEKCQKVGEKPKGVFYSVMRFMKEPQFQWMNEWDMKAFALSILLASQLTVRITLQNLVLMLVHHPHVLHRMQQEVDQITGDRRRPTAEDRLRMPYTEAVILENFRLNSINPFINRDVNDGFHFKGYFIPKGTMLQLNNWEISHSSNTFKQPFKFNPDRFLDESGQLLPRDHLYRQSNTTFGIGLRRCPGETHGFHKVFVYITCIVQRFHILAPINSEILSPDPRYQTETGLALHRPHFKCRLIARKKSQQKTCSTEK